jgi:hypothetical protein
MVHASPKVADQEVAVEQLDYRLVVVQADSPEFEASPWNAHLACCSHHLSIHQYRAESLAVTVVGTVCSLAQREEAGEEAGEEAQSWQAHSLVVAVVVEDHLVPHLVWGCFHVREPSRWHSVATVGRVQARHTRFRHTDSRSMVVAAALWGKPEGGEISCVDLGRGLGEEHGDLVVAPAAYAVSGCADLAHGIPECRNRRTVAYL